MMEMEYAEFAQEIDKTPFTTSLMLVPNLQVITQKDITWL
jgi:hypothetical protein